MSNPPSGRRPKLNQSNSKTYPYSFRHNGGNSYDILWHDIVELCRRAYGVSSFVVDKHRTTLMTKKVPYCDRIDLIGGAWTIKLGPHESSVLVDEADLSQALYALMRHNELVITRMITE